MSAVWRMRGVWLAVGLGMLLARGHLPVLDELAAGSGWTALPLAVAASAVIALALRGAAYITRWARSRAATRSAPSARPSRARPAPATRTPRASVLGRRLAGRAPPAPA